LRGILVFVAGVAIHRETAIAPPFEVSAGATVGFPKSRPPVTRRCGRRHEGGDLGRDRDQVIPVRLRDDGQQERGGGSSPRALLRIIELPHPIARRPPRGLVSRNTFNFVLMKTGKQAKASAWPTDIKSL
jgi:hypothetical protein